MKKPTFVLSLFAVMSAMFAIYMAFRSENAVVVHPKGIIAKNILHLIQTNVFLMLIILIPTLIVLLMVAWKYRIQNPKAKYDPEETLGFLGQLMLWVVPSIIVAIMAVITWYATHQLDPYKPIDSETKPLTIQVVALDWKWLFIYPEQEIATVNFVQFPAWTPIEFKLSADNSPMNAFWIPQLSGQIYAMTGMSTLLYMMAEESGVYRGKASEINGRGYAGMNFVAESTPQSDFDDWVKYVKQSPLKLTPAAYHELLKPSENHPITLYSFVDKNLFHEIVMKPMKPN